MRLRCSWRAPRVPLATSSVAQQQNQHSAELPPPSRRAPQTHPRKRTSAPPPAARRRAITAEQFGALALPVAEFLAVQHGTAYLGYSATTSEHARHPFFASANRSGGPAKGDIQLFTARRDTTLAQLLQKVCVHACVRACVFVCVCWVVLRVVLWVM